METTTFLLEKWVKWLKWLHQRQGDAKLTFWILSMPWNVTTSEWVAWFGWNWSDGLRETSHLRGFNPIRYIPDFSGIWIWSNYVTGVLFSTVTDYWLLDLSKIHVWVLHLIVFFFSFPLFGVVILYYLGKIYGNGCWMSIVRRC